MDPVIMGFIGVIISVWLGGLEWRMRSMDAKLRCVPSREEVNGTIDIKVDSLKVMQGELKEDIKELKHKVDKLISLQLRK